MKGRRLTCGTFSAILAIALALGTSTARPSVARDGASLSALWEQPQDLRGRDLLYGPWGAAHAPDPHASYTFIRPKEDGTNPGVVVRDPLGRTWHVKQPSQRWAEGPPEVVLSRVLSAVGYHQPPVYFVPSFTMTDAPGAHIEPGGRFRLEHESLTEQGNWSWRMNPFVGTPPYQGLLVILLMFANSDLKNSNNTIYRVARNGGEEEWYVVRDLGAALGEQGLFRPMRNDPALFERQPFVTGIANGFVEFDYPIKQRMLIEGRITPNEVAWASNLLAGLSDRQWHDAFRAGGYEPDVAARLIRKLRVNIAHGQQLSSTHPRSY